jgi:LEA14-like dessication related protein
MPSRRPLLCAALSASLLASCSVLPDYEAPKLSVITMKLQSADLFSQRVQMRMRVMNPNSRELPVKGITYRVEVDGAELGEGVAGAPFVVPAFGEAEFDVQFTANLAGALVKLLSKRGSHDSLEYRLVGSVALSSGFLRRIPFDERGSVKF